MGDLRQAFEYAGQNPNSDFAKNLKSLAESGALNVEAKKFGIDLSGFQQPKIASAPAQTIMQEKPKASIPEKILQFTGGDVLAKGLGQGLTTGYTKNLLDQTQKAQGEQQQKLIEAIRANKAVGHDTSRLEQALRDLTGGIVDTGAGAENLYNPNQITGSQIAGDALQLATTIGSVGTYGTAAKGAETGVLLSKAPSAVSTLTKSTGLLKGAAIGALKGAGEGAIIGGSAGVSQGLKNDLSSSEIALKGIEGAIGGAATGGVIGGITGGISGKLNAKKLIPAQEKSFVQDLVSPKATDAVKQQALAEGRVTEAGLLKKSTILPGKRDKQLAEAVSEFVSSKKPVTDNIDSITQGVRDINQGVKDYVKANKVPFNTNQLKTQLNKGKNELNLIFASDTQAEKTYDAVVKEFLNGVNNKDTAGLLDRRQGFDKIPAIKKLLDSQGLGENTKKEVVLTVRDMANKYIAKLLPEGNQYRPQLLKESKMIEALGNITEKNTKMIGQNKLQILTKEYPILKWIISGAVGAGGIGIGSTIIGSTDH